MTTHANVQARNLSAIVLSVLCGLVGFGLFFADPSPGTSLEGRLAISCTSAVLFGLMVGYLAPRLWPLVGTLAAWGEIVMGLAGLAIAQRLAGWILVVPLALTLFGSFCAARLHRHYHRQPM